MGPLCAVHAFLCLDFILSLRIFRLKILSEVSQFLENKEPPMAAFSRFWDKALLRSCLLLNKQDGRWGNRMNPDLPGAMRFLERLLVAHSS